MITANLTVAIVDDDTEDRVIFSDAIGEVAKGYELVEYSDGSEIVAQLRRSELNLPDIIFLDINMPLVGGFKTLEIIRKEMKLNVPVVMYSTSSYEMDINRALVAGANVYLTKPSDFTELKKAIHKILTMRIQYESNFDTFVLSVWESKYKSLYFIL